MLILQVSRGGSDGSTVLRHDFEGLLGREMNPSNGSAYARTRVNMRSGSALQQK